MKKSIAVLIFIALVSSVRGNIATPQAFISEIIVDSAGNWTIEMGFYEWSIIEIDSIVLKTSSGSSVISFYTLIPGGGSQYFDSLALITSLNLENPVSINLEGDFVKLISYAWEDDPFDSVAFGNYPGSYLDCIRDGESVIYLSYSQTQWSYTGSYCIDISPTIGSENDTIGALGSFSGVFFDLLGNPFTEGYFLLPGVENTTIQIQPDGSFSERIFARRFTFDTIEYYHPPSPSEYYTIEPVDFCLRPDSSHYQDIITTSLVEGIESKENDVENVITISPNPFADKVTFYFNLKNSHPSDELSLLIYSLDGREIHRIQLSSDQKRYDWAPAGSVTTGTLIYSLKKNNQVMKTGKFIKL
ncbi:MAG: T9SS type A sorting domain-containing protein [Bacteroidales bacterium]|nr:T9SS type A sorting domain-containing protein [Bacteroidales bacterium]